MKPKSNTQKIRKAAVLCCLLLCSVLWEDAGIAVK